MFYSLRENSVSIQHLRSQQGGDSYWGGLSLIFMLTNNFLMVKAPGFIRGVNPKSDIG
jgi:hypothetical protein